MDDVGEIPRVIENFLSVILSDFEPREIHGTCVHSDVEERVM